MSEFVIDKIEEYLKTLLPSLGLELFDIQFRQEDRGWVLRIYIDSEEGVGIDSCTKVSREISSYLEVEDIIDHAYHLEISSPGLERPIRNASEFKRYIGKDAKVKLHHPVENQKVFVGSIERVSEEEKITLLSDEGGEITFVMLDVNQARLYLR